MYTGSISIIWYVCSVAQIMLSLLCSVFVEEVYT